jgi:hypothetical protein
MKHLGTLHRLFRLLTATLIVIISCSCTKTIHDRRPTSTETPESREYFGCIVNGKHYISEARTGNVSGTCTYTATYDSASTFRIQSSHSLDNCGGGSIEIVLDSVELAEGKSFVLGSPGRGKNYARCSFNTDCSQPTIQVTTSDNTFSVIRIKNFKPEIKVVTATFFFNLVNDDGASFQVADGYFDRHFTLL